MPALYERSHDLFFSFHKTSWAQKLNYQPLLCFDLLLIGHLALTAYLMLWMPSSATLLSRCFLRKVLFPEDSHRERERKVFCYWLNMTGLPNLTHWVWDTPKWLRSPHSCSLPLVHAENCKIWGTAVFDFEKNKTMFLMKDKSLHLITDDVWYLICDCWKIMYWEIIFVFFLKKKI